MTSMAFLGVLPRPATGAGPWPMYHGYVLGGMLASTSISIFVCRYSLCFYPVLLRQKRIGYPQAHHAELMEKEKRVEEQNIDPELEYDFTHAGNLQNPGAV
jgi:HAE1 family hydrophobic/amphiphilic exporter-1